MNSPKMKLRRRELRKNYTKEELAVWHRIKNKQLGYRLVRQYSIGGYVVDFYCPKMRLAVELDGSQHNDDEGKEYDKERTRYLEAFGVKVIRFWNGDVLKNFEDVIGLIWKEWHDEE